MSIIVPRDPAAGESILGWARRINRIVKQLVPRESRDIMPESHPTLGTAYTLKRQAAPGAPAGGAAPAQQWTPVASATDPTKVRLGGWTDLMDDPDNLTSVRDITGLSDDFAPAAVGNIWRLELTYQASTADLNEVTLVFDTRWPEWPATYKRAGDGTDAQPYYLDKAYFPIAFVVRADNTTAPDGEGLAVTVRTHETDPASTVRVVRQVFTPLMLQPTMVGGFIVDYPVPWVRACQPDDVEGGGGRG